jgi:adenylate kinase family enzyme
MQRIRVVGTSGSGKTTMARRLAERLNLPHLELDALQHLGGWRAAPLGEFNQRLEAFLAASDPRGGWVIDGNYNARAPRLLEIADTIVWLDYPRQVVMARVLRRTVGRVVLRRQLWNGNRERLRTLFSRDPEVNVVLWAWAQHASDRRRYLARSHRPGTATWVRLTTPKQARAWLRNLV